LLDNTGYDFHSFVHIRLILGYFIYGKLLEKNIWGAPERRNSAVRFKPARFSCHYRMEKNFTDPISEYSRLAQFSGHLPVQFASFRTFNGIVDGPAFLLPVPLRMIIFSYAFRSK